MKMVKAQAEAGLLCANESEAVNSSLSCRRLGEARGRPAGSGAGQPQKFAMMGFLYYVRRKLIVTKSRTKRSAEFIDHLQALDRLYGPKPGSPTKPVVLVLDSGPDGDNAGEFRSGDRC
jgi:hypothetical protein